MRFVALPSGWKRRIVFWFPVRCESATFESVCAASPRRIHTLIQVSNWFFKATCNLCGAINHSSEHHHLQQSPNSSLSVSLFGATNSPHPHPPPPGPSSFLPSLPRAPVRAEAPCWCVSGLAACVVQVSVAVTSNQAAIISNVPHNWTPSNLATPSLLRF